MTQFRTLICVALLGGLAGSAGSLAYHNAKHFVTTFGPPPVVVTLVWEGPEGEMEVDVSEVYHRPNVASLTLDDDLWDTTAPSAEGETITADGAARFLGIWWGVARSDQAAAHVRHTAEEQFPGWSCVVKVEEVR